MDLLTLTLNQTTPQVKRGETSQFTWQWLAEGVLQCTPHQVYGKSIVLSAGVHGNETAPIELLNDICQDLFLGTLNLKVRLLIVFGNPDAMRAGQRYLDNDMNRMFCGAYQQLEPLKETLRAKQLEQLITDFFEADKTRRYHYDLHTAIRGSLLPTFAMMPYQTHAFDKVLLQSLDAADLDAVVYHNAVGKTFTHFTSETFNASSSTLELGKAKPFGQNDLQAFDAINRVIRAVIAETELPKRQKQPLQNFKVVSSIIKQHDDFVLNLTSDAPNFSTFQKDEIIATQTGHDDIASEQVWILFPNPNVKIGLRAGLILTSLDN